jgi:hypothetical protein
MLKSKSIKHGRTDLLRLVTANVFNDHHGFCESLFLISSNGKKYNSCDPTCFVCWQALYRLSKDLIAKYLCEWPPLHCLSDSEIPREPTDMDHLSESPPLCHIPFVSDHEIHCLSDSEISREPTDMDYLSESDDLMMLSEDFRPQSVSIPSELPKHVQPLFHSLSEPTDSDHAHEEKILHQTTHDSRVTASPNSLKRPKLSAILPTRRFCIGLTKEEQPCNLKAVYEGKRFPGVGPLFCKGCYDFIARQEVRANSDEYCRVCREGGDVRNELVICENGNEHGDCWDCIQKLQPKIFQALQVDREHVRFFCFECLIKL